MDESVQASTEKNTQHTTHPTRTNSAANESATIRVKFEQDGLLSVSCEGHALSQRCVGRSKFLTQLVDVEADGSVASWPLPFSVDTVKLWDSFTSCSSPQEVCQVLQVLLPVLLLVVCLVPAWFLALGLGLYVYVFASARCLKHSLLVHASSLVNS